VGFTVTAGIADAVGKVPARAWAPAYDRAEQLLEIYLKERAQEEGEGR